MDWKTLVSTNGVRMSLRTPSYGGPQKVGVSVSSSKVPVEVSVGGIQYNGLSWTFTETADGSVILTGMTRDTEVGFYMEFRNSTGETIRDEDGSLKKSLTLGALLEVGVISNGTSIQNENGQTIGAGVHIPILSSGIGYSYEEALNQGDSGDPKLITNTITIGSGVSDPGLIVTGAHVTEISKSVVDAQLDPSVVVNIPDLDSGNMYGKQYFILNAFDDTGGYYNEFIHWISGVGYGAAYPNTALAFEQGGKVVFYLRQGDGDEFFYDPSTEKYVAIDTGVKYLGVNVSAEEMATIHMAMGAAASAFSGVPLTIVTPVHRPENCFAADAIIEMWPTTLPESIAKDGPYDREKMIAGVWNKPIQEIEPGDLVLSYDKAGNLKPGKVTRIFRNQATHILDFWGSKVTPGHAYLCAEGRYGGTHIPLMDILREDAAVVRADGIEIRACTGMPVGDPLDAFVQVVVGAPTPEGGFEVRKAGKVRLGSRVLLEDGRDFCVADVIAAGGGQVSDDGLIATEGRPEGAPFHWPFGDSLPNPEDYILKRSGVTLAEIYAANEWESGRSRLSAPIQ